MYQGLFLSALRIPKTRLLVPQSFICMNANRSLKKGGRQAQQTSVISRRGSQKRNKGSRPALGERRRVEREALASLNDVTVDSDDNDGKDRESLSRRLLDKQFESSLPEVNYLTARDEQLRRTDVPERLQVYIWFPSPFIFGV